jgi:hypothetical protein
MRTHNITIYKYILLGEEGNNKKVLNLEMQATQASLAEENPSTHHIHKQHLSVSSPEPSHTWYYFILEFSCDRKGVLIFLSEW